MAGFDFQNVAGMFQGFRQNPLQFLMQRRINVPQALMGDPGSAIQYLMNSGQMSQGQYNTLQRMAQQMKSNPQFGKVFR